MSEEKRITLSDVFCYLREYLIEAREQNNQERLIEIKATFTILREVSYNSSDEQFTALATALEDSTRDAIMGVPWKSDIPSIEMIRLALSK